MIMKMTNRGKNHKLRREVRGVETIENISFSLKTISIIDWTYYENKKQKKQKLSKNKKKHFISKKLDKATSNKVEMQSDKNFITQIYFS